MSFSATSTNIEISPEGILSADCKTNLGHFKNSTIDLNGYIGNIDGNFKWGSEKFTLTASEFSLSDAILNGKLKKKDGTLNDSSIDLDQRIKNDNGELKYQ